MDDEILGYYRQELSRFRQLGQAFARSQPRIAGRLHLSADVCPDPHVERLIEAFSLIAARIRHKIDDAFPEVTDALLGMLYPHLTRPVPARTIAAFDLAPDEAPPDSAVRVPRGSRLESTQIPRGQGTAACQFRTGYDVELWPIDIETVEMGRFDNSPLRHLPLDGQAVLRLVLTTRGEATFSGLNIDRLRLFLDADQDTAGQLYEILVAGLTHAHVDAGGRAGPVAAPDIAIRPVGFDLNDGVFDYDARSFLAYRLIHEYFAFPEKFLFVDLAGLGPSLSACGQRAEILLVLQSPRWLDDPGDLFNRVTPEALRLGCTPVVNLFQQTCEPIRLTHSAVGYPVVVDVRRPAAYEVSSIDEVTLIRRSGGVERHNVLPIYSSAGVGSARTDQVYWHATRETAFDGALDTTVHFIDRGLAPTDASGTVASVVATCTNRDLPTRLAPGQPGGDLAMKDPVSAVGAIHFVRKPHGPVRPTIGRENQWRLISHLAHNHLSLADHDAAALRGHLQLLNLFEPRRDPYLFNQIRQQIDSVIELDADKVLRRVGSLSRASYCQGTAVTLTVDESLLGGGAFLFASLLERYLGLYCAANSFTELTVRSLQREEPVESWPPRAGAEILI